RIIRGMNWKIHVRCRVRNESICYIVFIDRTEPDNSVRINPATRHSETKYGFVILTGDMIFKDFFVGVKLLLRHEHLSSAAANSHQNQLTCHDSKTKLRVDLLTVRQPALVPSPRLLLSIPQKVHTGNVVMDS